MIAVAKQIPPPSPVTRRVSWMWPGMIFGLIGLNVCIVAVTVFYATRDPSVATEPDYYAKAVNFDQTIQQRTTNARLGWGATPSLAADADKRAMNLSVVLTDRNENPINGAEVSAVVFASARSGHRQTLVLRTVDPVAGRYAAPIAIDRAGVWEIRITAVHGGETFTRETDLLVPDISK